MRKSWGREEDSVVMDCSLSDEEKAEKLGRSVSSIRTRRGRIKAGEVSYKKKQRKWTGENAKLLMDENLSDEEMALKMGCSVNNIRHQRYRIYGTRSRSTAHWPLEHDKMILDVSIPVSQIARETGRTEEEIIMRRKLLQSGTTLYRRWTNEEKALILAGELSDDELSEKLSRSVTSIQRKRRVLKGSSKPNTYNYPDRTRCKTTYKYPNRRWTKEEEQLVLKHEITDFELSKQICRSMASIQNKRERLKRAMREKEQ